MIRMKESRSWGELWIGMGGARFDVEIESGRYMHSLRRKWSPWATKGTVPVFLFINHQPRIARSVIYNPLCSVPLKRFMKIHGQIPSIRSDGSSITSNNGNIFMTQVFAATDDPVRSNMASTYTQRVSHGRRSGASSMRCHISDTEAPAPIIGD